MAMRTTISGGRAQPGPPPEKMPGHWLLAKMGKRVLRPGGIELTRRLLEELNVGPADDVVEFAPGLGVTAQLTLARQPATYTAIERDDHAAATVRSYLYGPHRRCIVGDAAATGLDSESATVVYGEAMLSMQLPQVKSRIVHEAYRLLRGGGRYGIHELCLIPDDLAEEARNAIAHDLSAEIHVGVRPLTVAEWRRLLESEGFLVQSAASSPMHLLEPWRIVKDEGLGGALRFFWNVALQPEGRRRVLAMRRIFRKWSDHLAAIVLVGQKP
jgi:hypothetical protein